jgi:hypothetical protein
VFDSIFITASKQKLLLLLLQVRADRVSEKRFLQKKKSGTAERIPDVIEDIRNEKTGIIFDLQLS